MNTDSPIVSDIAVSWECDLGTVFAARETLDLPAERGLKRPICLAVLWVLPALERNQPPMRAAAINSLIALISTRRDDPIFT